MFRKRHRSMVDSQNLFRSLLVSSLFAGAFCDVTSFSLKSAQESLSGASVSLICTLDKYTNDIFIFKLDDITSVGQELSKCDDKNCRNVLPEYEFTITENTVEIKIISLQRASDQKWWRCRTTVGSDFQQSEKQFFLTVYTVPSSITLEGPTETCNLGQRDCEYTCMTDQCTYPLPTFTWLYVFDDDTTEVISKMTTDTENSNSCADRTMIYVNKLTFRRYQLFSGNKPKTVRLQCYITFTELSSGTCTSDVSHDVKFAVKVSTVQIFDGNNELNGNTLTVINKQEKLLKCVPGNGNPTPRVEWLIGSTQASTESDFRFIPNNSHHNQQIYCVAKNIPGEISDAVSNKPVLYVKVKIQFVYIEPAADTHISVIEDEPQAVVCATSAGRPGATIKWYKDDAEITEGGNTNYEATNYNLTVTKSTRNVTVLRSDSSWTLSCTASNFEGSSPILSNNSKQLNVLYPPERMGLLFNGSAVVGPVVDIIKGTSGTLKCIASSNPPVSVFSWNINQKFGDTLNIADNIHNGQMVNCTVRNIMTPTAGSTRNGYGSISKKINLQYGASIERFEVNGSTGSSWLIQENATILIACYVDSNPDSTISLLRGIKDLKESAQSTELFYNISAAQCSDTSQYTCKARNGIANIEQPASKTIQINVECSPRLAVDTGTSVFAPENTSAVLSVTILAYPIPTKYDWHRNTSNKWEKLSNSSSIRMIQASLQFRLTFTSVKPEDYGEYILTVYYTNDVPFNFTGVLKAHGETEPHITQPDDGPSATAGIIGGVVGGLILVCLIVIAICILRRRKSFDDIKTKLFGKTSSAVREEIQPQDAGYSYAAVEKPTGESALNIINNVNAETKLGGESTPAPGYLYSEVNKSSKDNPMTIMQDNKASESTDGKNKAKKTKAAPEKTNEGTCYENPTVLIESHAKAKPQKKGKPAKQKDKKQISQSHDGLQYVELSFSDTKKKGKKTKPVQPKADERTVYDAVQFGVVGGAYTSNGEENDTKK